MRKSHALVFCVVLGICFHRCCFCCCYCCSVCVIVTVCWTKVTIIISLFYKIIWNSIAKPDALRVMNYNITKMNHFNSCTQVFVQNWWNTTNSANTKMWPTLISQGRTCNKKFTSKPRQTAIPLLTKFLSNTIEYLVLMAYLLTIYLKDLQV